MRLALAISLLSSVALAQPIDISSGKFRNLTSTGVLKAAVIDAGVLNVEGAATVDGTLTCNGAVNTTGALTMADNTARMTGTTATFWFSAANGTTGRIASGISAANAGATAASAALKLYPDNALDATDYVLSVGTAANAATLFSVSYDGKAGFPANSGTCTLNGGSPATCTVTVTANAVCQCSLVGTTAAIAAMNCAVSLSGTTLTVTAANAANANVNVLCDR